MNEIKQSIVHAAEPLVPEHTYSDVANDIEMLKGCKLSNRLLIKFQKDCFEQLLKYHGLRSTTILTVNWNKEELPQL